LLAAPERRVYLNIENITGSGAPTSYAVYVNVPQGDSPQQHQELYAGLLPMFGLTEASRTDQTHNGSGLNYALEISDIIRTLEARSDWDPSKLRVTFVPEEVAPDGTSSNTRGEGEPVLRLKLRSDVPPEA